MTMTLRDLGRIGQTYFLVVVVAGGASLIWALYDTARNSTLDFGWLILAVLTIASSSVTLRLPSFPAVLTISETFVLTSVLLYGGAAGTMMVALDALAIGVWTRRHGNPLHKGVFTLCANTLAMSLGALLFNLTSNAPPLVGRQVSGETASALLLPLLVLATVYFTASSSLIAIAISLEKRQAAFTIWRRNFAWISLNYFAGASVAFVFVVYTPLTDPRYLIVAVPLVLVVYLAFVTSMGRIEDSNKHLGQLNRLYLATIETLATAIDAKDQVTHGHIRRVQQYAIALAEALGVEDETQVRAVEAASLLHDMGKLAVPDYILNKPGPLTPAEFDRMKTHASVGADILSSIQFPYPVVPIVRHHHENWDGTGYPDGLKGEDIPIGARILSVVDCFDALTSDRPYRPRLSDEAAMQIIHDRSGTMYDPLVVAKFGQVRHQIAIEEPSVISPSGPLAAITKASASAQDSPAQTRLDEISATSEEMLTLYEIARAVSGPFSFDDAAEIVARHLRRLIPTTFCVFYSYEADTDDLVAAHASGDAGRVLTGLRIAMGQRLTGWVGANRQTILNSDPVLDLGEAARMARPPLKSALSTALVSDNALVGVLTLYATAKSAFNEDHRRIIEAVARQVSGTLRNSLRFEQRKKSSLRDELTGLPSVERLRNLTEGLGGATQDVGDGTSIVLVDVDRLNDINQHLSRSAGDEVLARVAAIIRGCLEGGELLFRNTGDEFVIYMSRTERAQADRRARRFRQAVEDAYIVSPLGSGRVTVSVGVASLPGDGTSIEAALAAATRRMSIAPGTPPLRDRGSVH